MPVRRRAARTRSEQTNHAKAELDAALARALVRELRETWHRLNETHFDGGLQSPTLALCDSTVHLGRWSPETRSLEMSSELVLEQPWGSVVEVMRHEMAHQYVHEVLGADETPHGPTFRRTCERLGIDARAAGLAPAPAPAQSGSRAILIDRIRKLLALAGSDNRNEAESAANAAQRLMLRHNIDASEHGPRDDHGFRQVGRVTGRRQEWELRLSAILSSHFFVDCIWVPAYVAREGRSGRILELCGSPENLEIAGYVHEFLTRAAEGLWARHRRSGAVEGNRHRLTYLAGVMSGFAAKLDAQQEAHAEAGLVYVREPGVGEYLRRRHPHVRTTQNQGRPRNASYGDGQQAGRRIVLHRGVSRSASGERPALGPGDRA